MASEGYNLFEQFVKGVTHADEKDIIVIIAIPSHKGDDPSKEIKDQDQWAESASDLFAKLYTGATAFATKLGTFEDNEGKILVDKPIIVESLATVEQVMAEESLKLLFEFAKRMGKATKQKMVFISIDNTRHYIKP